MPAAEAASIPSLPVRASSGGRAGRGVDGVGLVGGSAGGVTTGGSAGGGVPGGVVGGVYGGLVGGVSSP